MRQLIGRHPGDPERSHEDRPVMATIRHSNPVTCWICNRVIQHTYHGWTFGLGAFCYCRTCKSNYADITPLVWRQYVPVLEDRTIVAVERIATTMEVHKAASLFLAANGAKRRLF